MKAPCTVDARRNRSAVDSGPSTGRTARSTSAAARSARARARAGAMRAPTTPPTSLGPTRSATPATVRIRHGLPGTGEKRGSASTRSIASATRGP